MDAKCIKFYEFGRPEDVLKVEYQSIGLPKENEVRVRMLSRPINPSDLIPITGAYSHRIALPNTPGYEGVGIVEAVGSLVSKSLIGQRVLPLRGEGTWQEFVKTAAELAVPIPDSIDDITAAQLYINPVTAWVICKEVLNLRANDCLVMNAAGSAIGRIFAQLARIFGFRFIAVTRNDTYTDDLLKLGASDVINTSKMPLYETIMDLTNGRGATAAIDSIGGTAGNDLAFCVRPNGNFLTIGLLSGIQVNWGEIVNKAKVNANMFHLRHWNQKVSTAQWQRTLTSVIKLVENQQLRLMKADAQYDLLDVKKAVEAVNSSKGKVFLTGRF
ncbi:alcohol dehydrogenase [Bacillus sp. J14TS2]|uniref:zinc-dependent alcohol dehydrogenase family protein n=1 Tax=Bacillus sp. J14TS2 TaxID=2807188 RepID=UPI001B16ACFE|nr:zinc-dependent alcohol dehydrogenase family protein [Bacillus sp. J14TS2]GIN72849.1 alcohol dehydrogenase [Bacillus sp. J14TS2]